MSDQAQNPYAGIEFVNESERQFFEEARFGVMAVEFLHTEIGRYLHGRAKAQVTEARDEILTLNPFDPADQIKMAAIQLQAATGEAFMRWLADLIQNGQMAEQQLNEFEQ